MLNLTHFGKLPVGVINPTRNNIIKNIKIVSKDTGKKYSIPVRIIRDEISGSQYLFLSLIFNFYTNA